jgi:hypothetical protein
VISVVRTALRNTELFAFRRSRAQRIGSSFAESVTGQYLPPKATGY